jgi:hypothetical protein
LGEGNPDRRNCPAAIAWAESTFEVASEEGGSVSDPLDELDHILDAVEATKSKTAEDQERARVERDAQTAAFANWAETVVVPTLEPFAERLRERGYDASVKVNTVESMHGLPPITHSVDFSAGDPSSVRATISIRALPDGVVELERAGGGTGNVRAAMPLQDVSPQVLRDAVLSTIRERFGPARA